MGVKEKSSQQLWSWSLVGPAIEPITGQRKDNELTHTFVWLRTFAKGLTLSVGLMVNPF